MAERVIRLDRISKQYAIGSARAGRYRTIRESLMHAVAAPIRRMRGGGGSGAPVTIWALRDVTADIEQGEALGLVGRNGAGKSTLLRILARITRPTSGRAELRGRVGSLLDVGTGFHPELTGRENTFLNGAILGMSRQGVRKNLDEIIEFAGVAEFIDTPVKHYSSGMRVRLAFSVAAQLETEILLADEVLAVGDASFQQKCMDRMGSMSRSGRTVIFVSHNMGAVGQLCSRVLLMDKGQVMESGRPQDIIRRYLSEFAPAAPASDVEPPREDHGMAVRTITLLDNVGRLASSHEWSAPFCIRVQFAVAQSLPALSLGITIVNQLGIRTLFSWVVFQQSFEPGSYAAEGEFEGGRLSPGRYSVDVNAERYGVEYYHVAERTAAFEIVKTSGDLGYELEEMAVLYAPVQWNIQPIVKAP